MTREIEIVELKSHFKTRKEVEEFFGDEVFKFTFMTEGTMYFETLNPIFLNEELHVFQLSFYHNDSHDFFAYSSFTDWLDKYQLSEVEIISKETNKRTQMYFDTWNENFKNK
tara:strand:- start:345 stop:680 length:336 start_codon:yes stop_codon:yes gene_type:complete